MAKSSREDEYSWLHSFDGGGYSPELFTAEVDPNLLCPICLMVFRDPIELECQHMYCRSCVEQVLNNNGMCPECKQWVKRSGAGHWLFEQPRRVFRNVHSNLRLRCSFAGCEHVTTIGEYDGHQASCSLNKSRTVQCKKCKSEMHAFEFDNHDCFQYLVSKVADVEERNTSLERQVEALKLKRRESQTSSTHVISELKQTVSLMELKLKDFEELCLVRIKCMRTSSHRDISRRTLTVMQSDTIKDIRSTFWEDAGFDDSPLKYAKVRCYDIDGTGTDLGKPLDINKTVKNHAIKNGYYLNFCES